MAAVFRNLRHDCAGRLALLRSGLAPCDMGAPRRAHDSYETMGGPPNAPLRYVFEDAEPSCAHRRGIEFHRRTASRFSRAQVQARVGGARRVAITSSGALQRMGRGKVRKRLTEGAGASDGPLFSSKTLLAVDYGKSRLSSSRRR
eukprot:2485108-Pyramimonas_sp.AAC.1